MKPVYYNDNDKAVCAWLKELMNDELIPQGEVDCRSIRDVSAGDLKGFRQCHFFAGIGGWPLALRLAGIDGEEGIWTGSCPCQPLSCAGKRKGHADERHLWPAFYRLIAQCRPAIIFGEQVASKAGREWFAGVRTDLEGMGYACGGADLCSAGVGSPNIRQRLYWVAHATGRRIDGGHIDQAPERLPQIAKPDEFCNSGRLADATSIGRETGQGECTIQRRMGQTCECEQRTGDHGPDERLANTPSGGQRTDRSASGPTGHAEQCHQNGGVGDTNKPGLQISTEKRISPGQATATDPPSNLPNFWSDTIWHPCRDGKQRRISPKPALFPLSPGLPGRVGLLRGAGNAINPQLAGAFIKASLEAMA